MCRAPKDLCQPIYTSFCLQHLHVFFLQLEKESQHGIRVTLSCMDVQFMSDNAELMSLKRCAQYEGSITMRKAELPNNRF